VDVPEVGRAHATLRLRAIRFTFEARDAIWFRAGTAANHLRGAFGSILRRQSEAAYLALFAPSGTVNGPSGLRDWPRPFVFRAHHLDGVSLEPGQTFYFDLHLFDLKQGMEEQLVLTFSQLADEGLGLGRRKVRLLSADASDIALPLGAGSGDVRGLTVQFVTPTELKRDNEVVTKPEFGVLAARTRDRICTLCELYGEGAPEIDFKAFGDRAALVVMTRCEVSPVHITRRSTRTGQVHPIGGLMGEAAYEGEIGEFMPWLEAAYWTGVGRQTVWGKGLIRCQSAR
jgi:hypothetical protein